MRTSASSGTEVACYRTKMTLVGSVHPISVLELTKNEVDERGRRGQNLNVHHGTLNINKCIYIRYAKNGHSVDGSADSIVD